MITAAAGAAAGAAVATRIGKNQKIETMKNHQNRRSQFKYGKMAGTLFNRQLKYGKIARAWTVGNRWNRWSQFK